MLAIRTDANEKIAMGHLMRCLSIARQLKKRGQEIIFIISEEYAIQQIKQYGFECICLCNHYDEKENEIDMLVEIIKFHKIEKLLLDSYEVTYRYMDILHKYCKVIYLDDLNGFRYPVDLIINYTLKTNISIYQERYYKDTIFLLGEKYVPLRPEFAQKPIEIKEKVKNIFLTTGGTDTYDMIIAILNKMQLEPVFQDIKKYVVVGQFYQNMEMLVNLAEKYSNIELFQNISDIYSIMKNCDIAISAGGTTLAELCACGIPTVCFAIADNQLIGTTRYANEKIMLYAGNVVEKREKVIENIIVNVQLLMNNYDMRKSIAKRANSIIDGKGADRITEHIIREWQNLEKNS